MLRADEMYVEGNLERDSYARLKQNYLDRRNNREARKRDLADEGSNIDEYLRYGFSLVSNLPGSYKKADLNGKHTFVGSIFPEKLIFENGGYRIRSILLDFSHGLSRKYALHPHPLQHPRYLNQFFREGLGRDSWQ